MGISSVEGFVVRWMQVRAAWQSSRVSSSPDWRRNYDQRSSTQTLFARHATHTSKPWQQGTAGSYCVKVGENKGAGQNMGASIMGCCQGTQAKSP